MDSEERKARESARKLLPACRPLGSLRASRFWRLPFALNAMLNLSNVTARSWRGSLALLYLKKKINNKNNGLLIVIVGWP